MENQYFPQHLLHNRYWKGLIHIFSHHDKLRRYLTTDYIDTNSCTIYAQKLKKLSAPWSQSEKFMLHLALHLFNERHKVNLSDMDYLDATNKEIAYRAIQKRYGL
ncbi:hypothetical protein [Gorillibacterium sp. sgz5001074]|uniref:hypothetical protein n=1 Tax=Gorillibacterium sp. sgz5001074 TaxID=3446695 RepID=UPI003F67885D